MTSVNLKLPTYCINHLSNSSILPSICHAIPCPSRDVVQSAQILTSCCGLPPASSLTGTLLILLRCPNPVPKLLNCLPPPDIELLWNLLFKCPLYHSWALTTLVQWSPTPSLTHCAHDLLKLLWLLTPYSGPKSPLPSPSHKCSIFCRDFIATHWPLLLPTPYTTTWQRIIIIKKNLWLEPWTPSRSQTIIHWVLSFPHGQGSVHSILQGSVPGDGQTSPEFAREARRVRFHLKE